MLRYLAAYSSTLYGPLRLFENPLFRGAIGLVMAFLLSLSVGPFFIRWMRRVKATEDMGKDSETLASLHAGKAGTPTMGGVIILLTAMGAAVLACDPSDPLVPLAMGVFLGFGVLGFIDDYMKLRKIGTRRGLSKRQKMLGQILLSGLAFWGMTYVGDHDTMRLLVPFMKWDPAGGVWQYTYPWAMAGGYMLLFYLVMVGCSNAVNLTDGLDGLATGVTIMTGLCFMVLAYVMGSESLTTYFRIPHIPAATELAIFCAVLVGALMGFLWFNSHPAQIFMGDTGSLAIGAVIAFVALAIKHELILILAGGVFVAEALSVVIQVISFRTTGKRVFKCAPLHHHLEFSGWPENKVVVRLWLAAAILSAAGVATVKLH